MRLHVFSGMLAGLSIPVWFMPGAASAPCPAGTISMNVTTVAELQNMINTINCTGEGTFDATWTGRLQLVQTIGLSNNKTLTVTGSSLVSANLPSAVIDGGSTAGLFQVYNESRLILKHLVLEGGKAENGAAVDARFNSSVYVVDCSFTNNNATTGGAIYASRSDVHIEGDTVFSDNTAQDDGGAIHVEQSTVHMDGTISFTDNSAGNDGGAISSGGSEVYVDGHTTFANNSATTDGGAMTAEGSDIYIYGDTTFTNNLVGDSGGAMAARNSDILINGNTLFLSNSVGSDGGAIVSVSSNVSIDGNTSFTSNTAVEEGGAVSSLRSVVTFSGDCLFGYNSAGDTGGAIMIRLSEVRFEGDTLFANNSAAARGGAMITLASEVYTNGSTTFSHNSAGLDGGAISTVTTDMNLTGEIIFEHNSARESGGAVFSGKTNLRLGGQIMFGYNSAGTNGGAMLVRTAPVLIEGNTTFTHNTARKSGGALVLSAGVEVDLIGITVFSHNSAVRIGGAIFIQISSISCTGTTSFVDNTAYGGGAIDAYESLIQMEGISKFVNNSVEWDGGAIAALRSNISIAGEAELSSNTAVNGGAIYATLCPSFALLGNMSIFGNYANFYGGAISLTDPSEIYLIGITFQSNRGTSGGAVYLASDVETTGGFGGCRFVDNNATTNGGALFLSTNATSEPEMARFVEDSVFFNNAADEFGGALYNAGAWEINNTVFSENTAGGGGLAIHDDGSSLVLWNDTFSGNMFRCPSDQYRDAHHDTGGTCRFELVCQQCSDGCEVNQMNAKVASDTIPTCEEIPFGVSPQSATTLATFDLLQGYYRVSDESRVIRECYQVEACLGGADSLNYCATGYTGPYCAVCTEGYAPGVLNLCHECSTTNRRWTVALVATFLVFGTLVAIFAVFHIFKEAEGGAGAVCPQPMLFCHKWLARGLPLSAIKILVVVLQIVTQFTEIAGAVYPDEYEAFLSKMTSVNLDIGFILSNSCLVTTDFYDRLVLATVGPLVVLAALFGTLWVARRRNTNTAVEEPLLESKRASTALFIIFFVYSSVSFTIFQTFVCDDLDDGMSYLRADYSIVCNTTTHAAYQAYASIMACVYPVGIPAFFGWWLARNRRDLAKPAREEMTHLESFRGLWAAYNPSCYYYEVVECSRRIALTGAAVFVLPNSAEQIAVIFLLAIVFTFISESLSPFETKADMWLYRWGNAIILASMYVALLLKVELADKESDASSLMTAVLIAANVFMIVIVVVQGLLLVKGLYGSRRSGEVHPALSTSVSTSQVASSAP